MRRVIAIAACLTVLMFAGASTALAGGPHHGGWGRGHGHHRHGHHGPRVNSFYRAPIVSPYCGIRPRVAAYPVCPVPAYPVIPTYPQLGFGIGGRNFSFWFQQ